MSKSGYNAARKKAIVGADRKKLDAITNYLNKNKEFGVVVTCSNYKVFNRFFKYGCHDTDLFLNRTVHLQHDTVKVHCELGYEKVKGDRNKNRIKTLRRNAEYFMANIPFCVINQDLAKELKIKEGPLCVYLYYHTVGKVDKDLAERLEIKKESLEEYLSYHTTMMDNARHAAKEME